MSRRCRQTGSVLLLVVLVVALLAATVMGHLQANTEEIQLLQNHLGGAEALALAEAGLNEALVRWRNDADWPGGSARRPLAGGSYVVTRDGPTIRSTGITSRGYVATMRAAIAVAPGGPPYEVQLTDLRINE